MRATGSLYVAAKPRQREDKGCTVLAPAPLGSGVESVQACELSHKRWLQETWCLGDTSRNQKFSALWERTINGLLQE